MGVGVRVYVRVGCEVCMSEGTCCVGVVYVCRC